MRHIQPSIRRKLPSLILLVLLSAAVLVFAPSSGGLAITAIVCGLFGAALIVLAFVPVGARTAQPQQPDAGPVQPGPPPAA